MTGLISADHPHGSSKSMIGHLRPGARSEDAPGAAIAN